MYRIITLETNQKKKKVRFSLSERKHYMIITCHLFLFFLGRKNVVYSVWNFILFFFGIWHSIKKLELFFFSKRNVQLTLFWKIFLYFSQILTILIYMYILFRKNKKNKKKRDEWPFEYVLNFHRIDEWEWPFEYVLNVHKQF